MLPRPALAALCLLLLGAGTAPAQVDRARLEGCVAAASPRAVSACIDAELAACAATPESQPAVAIQCFTDARQAFSAAVSESIAALADKIDARSASALRIETKYDLLAGLLRCDRLEELATLASDLPPQQVQRQATGCAAAVAGYGWRALTRRAEALEAR